MTPILCVGLGVEVRKIVAHASLDKLLDMMNYEGLRAEQVELRKGTFIAVSASRVSSKSPTQARRFTASAAPRFRPRMA